MAFVPFKISAGPPGKLDGCQVYFFSRQEMVDSALTALYNEIVNGNEKKGKLIEFKPSEHPVIIFTDLHKGTRDGADDFGICESNYLAALDYYQQRKFYYINLGDSEELWEKYPSECYQIQ